MLKSTSVPADSSSHLDLSDLILLVSEAVMKVACLSLPGYILARRGMFDAEMQKAVASLTLMIFTPCLIFVNLASQLTLDKLKDSAVIVFIFGCQTGVSYLCSIGTSKLFGFSERPRNFVVAMAVFGNSASVPLPLVTSLSQTVDRLRWDEVPGDNAQKVAARGILYLLIFQQLGLILRWSWGYNVLLAPPYRFEEEGDYANFATEQGQVVSRDEPEQEQEQEDSPTPRESNDTQSSFLRRARSESIDGSEDMAQRYRRGSQPESELELEPIMRRHRVSLTSEAPPTLEIRLDPLARPHVAPADTIVMTASGINDPQVSGVNTRPSTVQSDRQLAISLKGRSIRFREMVERGIGRIFSWIHTASDKIFRLLPDPLQKVFEKVFASICCFLHGLWGFMNPPLFAILLAIIVASAPSLQKVFFTGETFINNSLTRAISQGGDVAIPLILVVLGANLARNTIAEEPGHSTDGPEAEDRKLLIASLVSRMLLPTIVMVPLLALIAKKFTISILGDPILIVVCFLLSGAPSALQLAQICQINRVYVSVMSELLFQSYVVWIFPSTLVLVLCALQVVQ